MDRRYNKPSGVVVLTFSLSSALWILLLSDAIAQAPVSFPDKGKPGDVRSLIESNFQQASPTEKEAYIARLTGAADAYQGVDADRRQGALDFLTGTIWSISFMSGGDMYRSAAERDTRYAPVTIPDEIYRATYDSIVDFVEGQLHAALTWEPPSQERIAAVQGQLATLEERCRAIMSQKLVGADAAPIIEERLAPMRGLAMSAGQMFAPIQSSVPEEEFSEILRQFDTTLASIESVEILSPMERFEANLPVAGTDREISERRGALTDRGDRFWAVLNAVDEAFLGMTRASNPARAAGSGRVMQNYLSGIDYTKRAYRENAGLISEIFADISSKDVAYGPMIEMMLAQARSEHGDLPAVTPAAAVGALPEIPSGAEASGPSSSSRSWGLLVLLAMASLAAAFNHRLRLRSRPPGSS